MPIKRNRATKAGVFCRRGVCLAAALAAAAIGPIARGQQIAVEVHTAGVQDPNNPSQPFSLAVVHNDVLEPIQNYERYRERSQWEKAFKELEKLAAAKTTGLVPDKDGIMVPRPVLLQRLLAELSDEGKKAYRVFHDAEAKKLLEEAKGKDEADKLTSVATQFLFTSSGDVAADRLGDLSFERGDFARAVQAWRSILQYRPDSDISQAQLLVKIGMALARDGRWREFQDIEQQVRQRYANAKVRVGGQSVLALEPLEKLDHTAVEHAQRDGASQPANVQLDAECKPLWQFRWFALDNPSSGNRTGLMAYDQMYGTRFLSDFVPPATADDARVYSNLAGYDVGIDLETGKLLWRSGRFFDIVQKMAQGQNAFLEQSGILCTADRVWSVTRDPISQNDFHYKLVARNPTTGKQIKELRDWAMMGTPLADETRLFVAAYKASQSSELHVLALNRSDGKLLWDTRVGTYKADSRQQPYSYSRSIVPALLLAGGALYVDTNAGSIAKLNPNSGEIQWGLNYESEMPNTDRMYGQAPERCTTSAPLMVDGVLYFKGMRSRRLYAVDPDCPKVLWARPVSRNSVLCGIDQARIYLGGDEITAYDVKTRELLWSKPVPMGTSWVRPLTTADRIYQFTSRGIYEIDKSSGDVIQIFRGADMDSLGGSLIMTPRALLAVSNLAITAYPVKATGEERTAGEARASKPTDRQN